MAKSSVALVLQEHKTNKNGLHPIYLRITVDGKRNYLATGKYCSARMWDARNECLRDASDHAKLINSDLDLIKADALKKIVDDRVAGKLVTSVSVKRAAAAPGKGGKDFFQFAEKFIAASKARKNDRTIVNYVSHTKHFNSFIKGPIAFEEITPELLGKYEAHLRAAEMSDGYTRILLRHIRTVFNAAKKEGATDYYPFNNFSLPEENSRPKEFLSHEEVRKIEKHLKHLSGASLSSALYFLLGCYTGLRVSDWKTFDQDEAVRDGWVRTVARKNKTWVTMPVPPGLSRILPLLAENSCIQYEQQINESLGRILPEIGITRHITTHCARHTFAVTMCAERGISCEVCAELMGITVQVCSETYYKVTNVKIEKEVKKAWKGL
ncbi:site-specific integrase [Flavihumibacter petaseus]|uniref:Recombinase n=1 Tax=Flavihumibacter petaseus NBRC 106054 TaxID=1220578 RepID=A0A0E9N1L9_9BACT|nr:site-specific integrase [Flavihumibacter petaseus]GAO43749.1 hypothetical protein FPE01S_02_08550 [Flavihumibacter petaseus NBRC 106054]